jgi:hypothetical protein
MAKICCEFPGCDATSIKLAIDGWVRLAEPPGLYCPSHAAAAMNEGPALLEAKREWLKLSPSEQREMCEWLLDDLDDLNVPQELRTLQGFRSWLLERKP